MQKKRQSANLTPLKSCPNGNNGTIIANNLGYSLCSQSQYNVGSWQWPVVADDNACALLCSNTNGCTTAVFDRTNGNCHIKGNPDANSYNFVYDNRFDAIRLAYTPTQGADVNGNCPFGSYNFVNSTGSIFNICPMTDYPVSSQQVLQNVKSATDCSALCTSQNSCTNAVYDHVYNSCHIKGSLDANAPWKVNTQFDTIRLVYTPKAGNTINSSCPFGGYNFIGTDGAVYSVCPDSDYPVNSLQVIPNVYSATACSALCTAQNNNCKNAVYDHQYNYCHIKGTLANTAPWKISAQFDTIQMISAPLSSSTTATTTTTAAPTSTSTTATSVSTTSTSAAATYTPVNGTPIEGACPSGAYNYTSAAGAIYSICPNSDYPVNTLQLLQNINSATDCASQCTYNSNTCTNAVFDHQNNYCHIKGQLDSTAPWNVNTQFDTIQLIYSPQDGTPIYGSSCPKGGSSYTSKNNIVYTICPNTDFGVGNLANIAAKDIQTCAEICSTTAGCYNVVYEPGTCHIKGAPYQANFKSSNYYSTIIVSNTTANNKALAPRNGQWGNVIPLDVNPVAAYLVPAYPSVKQFLSFASWSPSTFGGPASYQTAFASYDVTTNTQGEFTVANTHHNMFCPGMNSLPDGRLMIDGGDTDQAATLYDPFANTFTRAANMTMGRGYQSSVTLSNGKTFTIGGSFTGGIGGQNGVPMKNGEIYDYTTNQWSPLSGALVQPMLQTYDNAGAWRTDNHAWLHAWSGGSVFQAGPSKNMNWYSTTGSGGVQSAGVRNNNNDQMCGISVMYDNGKILSTGGAQSYTDNNALNVAHVVTLNGVNKAPTVQQIQNMNYPRSFHNAIVLPNGQVFITGGQSYAAVFTDTQSVLQSEIFDPSTKTFTTVAPASIPRNYHSSTVLLPDGRVMSGGGGLCYVNGNCNNANHQDIQFYSPPYLFDANGNPASRPTVKSITSSQQQSEKVRVNPGGTLTVNLSSVSGLTHVLVRMGSSTHSVDTDQRRIPLSVKKTSGTTVTLSIPNDNGIVPPGFWYYFAVSSNGAHSIGLTVNVLAV
ncbi:hypothetical protein L7F22_019840 [Adiantum nelumboides]|nr:hypothetical protein [Adiantum nelumboides]